VLEWAQRRWRDEVDALAVTLQTHWQQLVEESLAETHHVVVGTRVTSRGYIPDTTEGVLIALGLTTTPAEHGVGLVPLRVARWLHSSARGLSAEFTDPLARGEQLPDEAALETARVLWAPLDDTSPYHLLINALAAARRL